MKVPVYCSLLPTELLAHNGCELKLLPAEEITSCRGGEYHCAFHENLCSYSKSLYDYFLQNYSEFDLIIVPSSCDAMKKLFNALREKLPEEKLYLFDMPQLKTKGAAKFLAGEMERLESVIARPLGRSNPPELTVSPRRFAPRDDSESLFTTTENKIALLGANIPLGIFKDSARKFGLEIVNLNHCLTKAGPDSELLQYLERGNIEKYAEEFLKKNSCPRTYDYGYKERLKKEILGGFYKGVIINSLKFCDYHPFDYIYLKGEIKGELPVLQIEHELTADYEGQTMTRLEAFFESIQKGVKKKKKRAKSDGYFVGVDSGSHATKLVCVDADERIIARHVVNTGTSVTKSSARLFELLENENRVKRRDIAKIVATGYGRNKIAGADENITEISCHALGAHHVLGKQGTIIDIGGQDSKAIKIDSNGGVIRFAMNDKCAAGTGRFLEVMAAKLEMSLEEFAELSLAADRHVPISSMCSVFAESEVISLIASGSSKEEIAKGIHKSIADRTIALAKRIDGEPPYYMAGGVAKNKGLVRELEASLGRKLEVIENPQFSGALGAALIAARS